MTKQDFELIAETVRALGAPQYGYCRPVIRQHVANAFADRCGATNPRFDRARFLKACGVQS